MGPQLNANLAPAQKQVGMVILGVREGANPVYEVQRLRKIWKLPGFGEPGADFPIGQCGGQPRDFFGGQGGHRAVAGQAMTEDQ